MTNGVVEPSGRYHSSNNGAATAAPPSMMSYDFHDNLSGVFDAAFSAAVAGGQRRGAYDAYDGMPPPLMQQVLFLMVSLIAFLLVPFLIGAVL